MDNKGDGYVDCTEEKKMLFCHCCKAKFIGALNDRLSLQQKDFIASVCHLIFKLVVE
ncbi:hypothetical protein DEO72_LG11g2202 [Vigna unguiculata]|uniref:Uncharacterized protein n=1 Tax=Vigna unguiculata TaxID=3917 RepID=A0A4D6NMZ0_VIGUN|nr:hypothetical protein DEO72_LG11g2202 [Vigna unguiculata]